MRFHYVLLALLIAAFPVGADTMAAPPPVITKDFKRYAVAGGFNDVKVFLVSAIEERGLKINNTSFIGKMLQRTGEDVGDAKPIYTQAEAVEFCSATLSREMMQADPHNIVFCPYTILIYELAGDPGTVYLSYRRPIYQAGGVNHASLGKIDELLTGIIKEVVE